MKVKTPSTVRKLVLDTLIKVKRNLIMSGNLTDVWHTPDRWYNDTWYTNVAYSQGERKKVIIAD